MEDETMRLAEIIEQIEIEEEVIENRQKEFASRLLTRIDSIIEQYWN